MSQRSGSGTSPEVPEITATELKELDGTPEIVCYCRSGARSAWAVTRLLDAGYEGVWNLKGGVLAWREEVALNLTAY